MRNKTNSLLIPLILIAASVQAAKITWTAHPITGDVADVSTRGTLVEARNGSARQSMTVNGVTFETVEESGNLFDTLFKNDNISRRGYSTEVTDPNYKGFLQYGQRSGRNVAKPFATVTFTDLNVGHRYEIQIWVSDNVNTAGDSGLVLGDGIGGAPVHGADTTLLTEVAEDGVGQYGIGTFVADATRQSFNVRSYRNLLTSPKAKDHLHFSNGWQLRDLGPSGSNNLTRPAARKPENTEATKADAHAGRAAGKPQRPANYKWDDDPDGVKVFILAGQSNMVGYGKTEIGGNPEWTKGGDAPKEIKGGLGSLRYLAIHDSTYPEYNYRSLLENPNQPKTSNWKTRSDVKVWWRDGHSGQLGGAIRKGDLGLPFQGGNVSWFGPEYGFGQIIGDYYKDEDVLLIKTAWGGRSLAGDFRPPSAVAQRGGEVGEFYEAILDNTYEVLSNLGEAFPEWSGKGYQIVGIGWHQGFNDRVTEEFAPEYKDNLPDLIYDLRSAFGQPLLPFVVASTGMGSAGPVEPYPFTGYSEVEKAQLWVAGIDQPGNVVSVDTRPFWREPERAVSTMGHHWNHSGESYFLIGKAMADNMVLLLDRLSMDQGF